VVVKKTKKETKQKSSSKKEAKISKNVEKVEKVESPKPAVVFKSKAVIGAEKYLKSVGTKPRHIKPLMVWANSQGYAQETADRWKEIFANL
jgi:hypothetical protein